MKILTKLMLASAVMITSGFADPGDTILGANGDVAELDGVFGDTNYVAKDGGTIVQDYDASIKSQMYVCGDFDGNGSANWYVYEFVNPEGSHRVVLDKVPGLTEYGDSGDWYIYKGGKWEASNDLFEYLVKGGRIDGDLDKFTTDLDETISLSAANYKPTGMSSSSIIIKGMNVSYGDDYALTYLNGKVHDLVDDDTDLSGDVLSGKTAKKVEVFGEKCFMPPLPDRIAKR